MTHARSATAEAPERRKAFLCKKWRFSVPRCFREPGRGWQRLVIGCSASHGLTRLNEKLSPQQDQNPGRAPMFRDRAHAALAIPGIKTDPGA